MSESEAVGSTILVVDDEPNLAEMYSTFLEGDYDVLTATGGEEALEYMDDEVDVVLLDRRMPDMSGDDVLAEFRERGYGVPVGMLTAVEPDVDIVELPFDEYILKPIRRDDLQKKVEILINRAEFDDASRELYRLASKKATLEARDTFDHTASEEYHELVERMAELRSEMDETLDDLFEDDPDAAFRGL